MASQVVNSIFSGIGGFEVGFARAGLTTALMCERDSSAQAVLRQRFPDTGLVDDVTTMSDLPACDVLVGGWPCQDLSQAGRMAGLDGNHSGLISHVFRLIDASKVKPNTVILENVAFSLKLQKGKAIRYVTKELEARSYRWAYRILDTREFGLPHRRRRIFICGMREGDPADILFDGVDRPARRDGKPRHVGFYWTEGNRGVGWTLDAVPPLKGGSTVHIPSPPAIWTVASGAFRTPGIEDAERLQGFDAGWTSAARELPKGERSRWRLVGNAVSVPVAEWLGTRLHGNEKCVLDYHAFGTKDDVQHNAAWGGPGELPRYIAAAGEGPGTHRRLTVSKFGLEDATALSRRAAEGFLRRYMKSGLIKNMQFAHALASHCGLRKLPA
jgi:DNA (cytosine-5)-methyltransferase 1